MSLKKPVASVATEIPDTISGREIREMFAGLTDATVQFVLRDLRKQFIDAISAVNRKCYEGKTPLTNICPKPALVMNAFRLCPIENAKVVLLGQDPYIREGQAQGLSFSVPKGFAIPPSLAAIYGCMTHSGILPSRPSSGDLTSWAKQGVLMYNSALTTKLGESNAHQSCWRAYTDALIKHMSAKLTGVVFILLGTDAQGKKDLIDSKKHVVLLWGHPSPLSKFNQSDNPQNFKYCDVFSRANKILDEPIRWDSVCDGESVPPQTPPQQTSQTPQPPQQTPQPPTGTIVTDNNAGANLRTHAEVSAKSFYIFTDGGATANGKKNCRASWAYCVITPDQSYTKSAMCEPVNIPGIEYTMSNNRGELTAIVGAMEAADKLLDAAPQAHVTIVCDSEYGIKCVTKWMYDWKKKGDAEVKKKKNVDLIEPANAYYDKNRKRISMIHVGSHKKEPADKKTKEWFIWSGNDIVDKACAALLKK